MSGPVVLLTDFGDQDPFVGIMKGVITGIHPGSRLLDLNHRIPPQNVRRAAFELLAAAPYFPKGSLFVAVVDPGVGSKRKILLAQTRRHLFLAPDNGLLSWVLEKEPPLRLVSVENSRYFLKPVSRTFHGRDIFAPVAAHCARGVPIGRFGPSARAYARLPFPRPRLQGKRMAGEVLAQDRFGNLVTNFPNRLAAKAAALRIKSALVKGVADTYSSAPEGRLLCLPGSHGFLEIARRNGSAAALLRAGEGMQIELRLRAAGGLQ